ncbi:MAG TPA: FAD-dependent oxidoreductase, partial [Thermodesulfovibrionales bacterium]|nr:FAD-dependent oxidoreductase [Thermodesulfovibrionales bacterium]
VLASDREIDVTSPDGTHEKIAADSIIIATGSRPAGIPSVPFDGKYVISSTEALEITEVPRRLLIVGGGVIGCEFACIYRELGSEVTIIEALPRAVATEDREISEILEKELKKKKIRLLTGTQIESVSVRDNTAYARLSGGSELAADKVLISVGRSLNTENIGIEHLGIKRGGRGEIVVNEKMETNVPGIYAVGDVTGGMLLAHKASAEGVVAAKNITGVPCSMDYRIIPSAIFTSPEIASVGLREHQAAEGGIAFRKGVFPFRALGRAHAMGEISGIVKVLSDSVTGRIIGTHIIGPHASDLIHEAAVAMKAGMQAHDLAGTIHAHPTLSEALMEASEDVNGEAVHLPKK